MADPGSHRIAPWTDEQARAAMLDLAATAAEGWAEAVFLRVEGALSCLIFDECGELRQWIEATTAGAVLNLVEDGERIAADLELSPGRRRKLILERAAIYNARLAELVAVAPTRGSA